MEVDDMVLVSVDDHVVEPPTMFEGRLPARFQDRAPRVKRREDGTDVWLFEDETVVNLALAATAGRVPEEYNVNPASFDEIRRGCFDVHERVRDMNAGGVLSSLNFPSFPQFCGQLFSRQKDKELSLAVIQAYNDWHVEDWAGAYPGRFIPLALMPLWDAELMAAEVRRNAARGCRAVAFSENPEAIGFPSFHSPSWDPFWQACVDTDTVICMHIGSSSRLPMTSSDAPMEASISVTPVNLLLTTGDLLWSRVLRNYPTLHMALSEGGIGWIPYFLERADYVYDRQHRWTGNDLDGRHPSELFREHMITCFIDDQVGIELRDKIGVDIICWEHDYPHSDSPWPMGPEQLMKSLDGVTDEEIDKISHLNALRAFNYDPFAHVPRERATVGALRAQAHDVDTSLKSYGLRSAGPTIGTPTDAHDAGARGNS